MSNIAKRILSTPSIIQEICKTVTDITGVQLGDRQSAMVQSRLKKRLTELQLASEQEYFAYFLENRDSETKALISLLTTHHTYFFRESSHFDYLIDSAIPALIPQIRNRPGKTLQIWSAACSKGHEVYSIAMLLAAHMPRIAPDIKYNVFGTDVDEESVKISINGVYPYNEIKKIPTSLANDHWVRGTAEISNFAKARRSLKDHCSFATANLLDFQAVAMPPQFDIIFCRNVFIYFSTEQIKDISIRLLKKLSPGGVLFIGISETLNGMNLPIKILGPSIYQSTLNAVPATNPTEKAAAIPPLNKIPAPLSMPNPLKVLCVDDSTSVLMLLKEILKSEQGFEVVATAGNGIEAAKMMKEHKFDVMTLDIHMPEQNGLDYLKNNFGMNHPPVVIISSASREDGDLTIRCLEAGASDFVEKPTLRNMVESKEEICNKLRSAWRSKASGLVKTASVSSIDRSFATTIAVKNPDRYCRIVVASLADRDKLIDLFKNLKGTQPPTVILIDGSENIISALAKSISAQIGALIAPIESPVEVAPPGAIQIGSLNQLFADVKRAYHPRQTSFLVYDSASKSVKSKITQWPGAHVIVEDRGTAAKDNPLASIANDLVPHTSFAYLAVQLMSRSDD